ncbi:Cullin-4B [Hygrophoropsis aurantiaca]|uniref:Cullin-4B n=1 Tax=Hygrophoropsis aurantiaca TaxID=72124 RepID=A0ACB8A2G3_9AGAM|nr:Cullin-4B [Hygrophoropsis aurantiaca]
MTDALSLLTLPQTSKGFTALRPTIIDTIDEGSASHPRKTPRLDADSDSGSASRSRDRAQPSNNGPIRMQVIGIEARLTTADKASGSDNNFVLLRACMRFVLAKDSKDRLPASYETIYSACRSVVCVAGKGEGLYGALTMEIVQSVARLAGELEKKGKEGLDWIAQLVEICAWFETQIALLQSLLTYLDRSYVLRHQQLQNIRDLAYATFCDRIFHSFAIVEKIRMGVEEWVKWERVNRKEHPQRNSVKSLVTHLVTHETYATVLEATYLQHATNFYKDESEVKTQAEKSIAYEFLTLCRQRVDEEEARVKEVLLESTWPLVKEATQNALLVGQLPWLAKEAIGPMIESQKVERLAMAYSLFASVNGLSVFRAEFKSYIQATVEKIVKDTTRDDDMVARLLELKTFADTALNTAFVSPNIPTAPSNRDFQNALKDAFANGFKSRRNKPAELIAKRLDSLMRRGQKGMTDAAFAGLLDASLALYAFTEDKDVFRTFYHRALAKRLLLDRSASDDFEKAMLKKLKEDYDPEFGMGDHMFTDLQLSRDSMKEFHRKYDTDRSAHKLTVMVLQRGVWPFSARKKDIDLPLIMQEDLAEYTKFYTNKHAGRKLDWDHSLGTATLKARFPAGSKDLTVSLYQAIVLLLFNEDVELGYKQIAEATMMEESELKRTLQSLACGNKKVLKKRPVGKDVHDDDAFYFNAEFTDPRAKVHINSIQVKETAEESKRTQTAIEGDRKHYLDAAIVRIMKAKKELHYEQLKTLTIDTVKTHFVPEVPVIKQRIAGLVEQEYLRRDEDDMNLYIYVA